MSKRKFESKIDLENIFVDQKPFLQDGQVGSFIQRESHDSLLCHFTRLRRSVLRLVLASLRWVLLLPVSLVTNLLDCNHGFYEHLILQHDWAGLS